RRLLAAGLDRAEVPARVPGQDQDAGRQRRPGRGRGARMIKLTIDGKPLEVEPGTNVLEAAAKLGIEIPHYCYHPDIGVDGNCRMCLVQVGDGTRKLPIACMLPCAENMVVQTASPAVVKARKG